MHNIKYSCIHLTSLLLMTCLLTLLPTQNSVTLFHPLDARSWRSRATDADHAAENDAAERRR